MHTGAHLPINYTITATTILLLSLLTANYNARADTLSLLISDCGQKREGERERSKENTEWLINLAE